MQIYRKIRDILSMLILFLVLATTINAQSLENINLDSNDADLPIDRMPLAGIFSLLLNESELAECGIAADCGNINQCTIYDCVDSMCVFIDIKSEGSLIWQENFENDAPGSLPGGWTAGPGPFFWAIGFSNSDTAPFSLENNGPNDVSADTGTVTLPDMTIPSDGGFFSYYLSLSRSPAYNLVADTLNDVLAILIDGQLVNIENTDNSSFVERVIDLPAATYANQSISISFEWRSGNNSIGKVIIDTLSLRAHEPCNDNNVCTSDDLCTVGSCGGTIIPNCIE